MKKIVSLLAILALVFAMVAFVGCDNGNGGTPDKPDSDPLVNGSDPVEGGDNGDDETPAGETYTVVLNSTYTATENTYGADPNGETQVKIPTNISGLKVGDKVVLKMKGTASYEVPVMEICLADTSEAAGWWKLLADDANYTQENVTDFDIEHTFVVTAEPVTGAEIVINGKGSRNTLTFDCTAKDDDDEGGEGDNNEGAGGEGGEEAPVVVFEGEKAITWSDFCMIPAGNFEGDEPKAIEVTYNAVFTDYIAVRLNVGYAGGLGAGTIEGASLKTDDAGALEGMAANGTVGATFTYTPTAEEWAAIKASDGFGMNGNGAVITKVVLK